MKVSNYKQNSFIYFVLKKKRLLCQITYPMKINNIFGVFLQSDQALGIIFISKMFISMTVSIRQFLTIMPALSV